MPVVPAPTLPTVAPTSDSGLPYSSGAGATPQAFGADIGVAEQGLAAQIGRTGDMLERHAQSLQHDVNMSAAKDLFLEGDMKIGQLQVQYDGLQGAAKVNALSKFYEDVAAVRAEMKAKAPNAEVVEKALIELEALSFAIRRVTKAVDQAIDRLNKKKD